MFASVRSSHVAALICCSMLAVLYSASSAAASPLFTTISAELVEERYAPTAALLPDGDVLITGGYYQKGFAHLKTAEEYDPATRAFAPLAAYQTIQRSEDASVALPEGKVLILGGSNNNNEPLSSAELFNPATSTFEAIAASMTEPRDGPAAALLHNGMVFITAGANKGGDATSAELYDPQTQKFSPITGKPSEGRYFPAAATLPDGNVLIAGGIPPCCGGALATSEIFTPSTGKFELLEGTAHEMRERRGELAAVALQNGRVLLVGGNNESSVLKTVELFNSTANTFELLKAELVDERRGSAVALLSDGNVLIAAGCQKTGCSKSAELMSLGPPLRATTGRATRVSRRGATLSALVESETVSTVYFQWGTSRRFRHQTRRQVIDASQLSRSVSARLTRLTPGRRYYYRVVVSNAGGTLRGADRTFVAPRRR
ncbi:MAG TPA: kelch repeat-containing protein [Solirubrobacteraceae bacterium]|nr:kelch repeat-containing protein [Solirubrobacteraceae bacterium]